jgi:hypothetical protein
MDELLFLLRIAAALGALTVLLLVVRRQIGPLRLPGTAARPRLCPHLGLTSDPFKHYPGANEEHRCYVSLGRERIDLAHQRRFCLASSYSRCPFLLVTAQRPGLLERIWAWGRAVSPIPQAQAGVPRRPLGSPWGPLPLMNRAALAEALEALGTSERWPMLRELARETLLLLAMLGARAAAWLRTQAASLMAARRTRTAAAAGAAVPVPAR